MSNSSPMRSDGVEGSTEMLPKPKRMGPGDSVPELDQQGSDVQNEPLPSIPAQFKMIVTESYFSVLLLLIPASFILRVMQTPLWMMFIISFFSLIPLASILGDLTEEAARHSNASIGALLNATFGNATELIISVFALFSTMNPAQQVEVIQLSLVGSVLGNMLLVLGCSMLAGGLRWGTVWFAVGSVNAYLGVLLLALFSIVLPSVFAQGPWSERVLPLSRLVSVLMIFAYGLFMVFQMRTHAGMFSVEIDQDEANADAQRAGDPCGRPKADLVAAESAALRERERGDRGRGGGRGGAGRKADATSTEITPFLHRGGVASPHSVGSPGTRDTASATATGDDDGSEGTSDTDSPVMSWPVAVGGLAVTTILISIESEMLVNTIEPFAKTVGVPSAFVAAILLPIVGNVAEHATAVMMAYKGKLDISLGVAIGSSIQIALFVLPVMVLVAWVADVPLSLATSPFTASAAFLSALLVHHLVNDGRSNWLEGAIMLVVYAIICLCFIFLPITGAALLPASLHRGVK